MSKSNSPVVRIAMWSGPRNISTAMMRSFENRPDTHVIDEPFYGAFLAAGKVRHPMHEEILAQTETDPDAVRDSLLTDGSREGVFYQKHMTHHMLDHFPRDWVLHVTNAFLIRDPQRVVASYAAKRADVAFEDLGFGQQNEIFDAVADHLGEAPPVLDADDVLRAPRAALMQLCTACAIPFHEEMLNWPAGPRDSDGVWAAHWYGAVERSTGFGPPPETMPQLDGELARLAEEARPFYDRLHALRLRV